MKTQNVNFCGKADILVQIAKAPKTPRGFSRRDLTNAMELLGYRHNRTRGSHRIFRNSDGDILTIAAAGNTVDPKSVKQVQDILRKKRPDLF